MSFIEPPTIEEIREKEQKYRGGYIGHVKRVIITVVGFTVLGLGVVMIALPGPAFLVIPAGLAILATEYAWARRWLRRAKAYVRKARTKINNMRRSA